MINKVCFFIGAKDCIEYLKIHEGTKKLEDSVLSLWNNVFSGIKYYVKKINHECKTFPDCKGLPECEEFGKTKIGYAGDFDKIKFISDDNLPLGKLIYFLTITTVIRCVFKQGDLFILKFI